MIMNEPTTHADQTNWNVTYEDVEPIRIRDPAAEALAVLDRGEPFVISYDDVIKEAGHSCPTASGSYRLTQLGLDALYPDEHPVRGEIEVTAGGPKEDPAYGVTSRIVSYITGAAEEDGFSGLAGGYGCRRHRLRFGEIGTTEPAFVFTRTDTDESLRVTYHVSDVPDAGPTTRYLDEMIDGTATADEREAFAEAWHGRVERVLTDDSLFTVEQSEAVG
jgi:hypothetical protein